MTGDIESVIERQLLRSVVRNKLKASYLMFHIMAAKHLLVYAF
jgi:hypothetical protein